MTKKGRTILGAVGDVLVDRDDPAFPFAAVKPVLDQADFLFGNCEGVYMDKTGRYPSPATPGGLVVKPENAKGLASAGFNVMSLANNASLDWGYEGFYSTIDVLRSNGIATVGVGKNEAEARTPLVLEHNGNKIAFLAYVTVVLPGFPAGPNRAGVAPMRALAAYEVVSHFPPATQLTAYTFPHPKDLAALRKDIEQARKVADVVAVSFHWGAINTPVRLPDYELELGRITIDAGADLVFGHHQHLLRSIERYHGKFIFHGLGNFAFDLWDVEKRLGPNIIKASRELEGDYGVGPREGYPSFPYHPDARQTLVTFCHIENGAVADVSFVPCLINADGQPVPLEAASKEFHGVIDFVKKANDLDGFDTQFAVRGQDVHLS